jgi:choline-phosphate cytidylyltransferase
VSWIKKNELEIKRHVMELRDNIKNNWTATGQELSRELRQLWQNSRPGSPAPSARNSMDLGSVRGGNGGLTSPTGGQKSHVSRLEALGRPDSPGGPNGRNEDFATGYSLGLIGGVRAWVCDYLSCHDDRDVDQNLQMMRSRRSLMESRPHSPTSEDEHEPELEATNGHTDSERSLHAAS